MAERYAVRAKGGVTKVRAHILVLAVYVALLATVGAVGAYALGNVIASIVQALSR